MPKINSLFKRGANNTSMAFRPNIDRLADVIQYLRNTEAFGPEWFLMGDTEQDSYLYPAFDAAGHLTPAAEAVLETRFKGKKSRYLGVWNGKLEEGEGASMVFKFRESDWPASSLEIDHQDGVTRLGFDQVKELLSIIAVELRPMVITVARNQYSDKQVFRDRPGAGWMLYLPHVLTSSQVLEARELQPVMAKQENGKAFQIGTIVVTVNSEPFSDENPEHVKIANAIEIRLVDQDLLPRYADL
ncbi:Imm52 family immunity protein [Rugamonas aquatica]|uniref:Uncharacterized protein n=1 Tax=Rugamonas aquatica TaxID=2743357 RepID=A0A6A7N726_9BURK|nr:Imm52 family immunity protein [Rugamonas aquatica]MQA40678.1 hypothetical protein [Rugamonas aquatica]